MHLLTSGLKLAAGRALEDLLERSTATRTRGLAAGILITSLVQSSTAVTVASIGFVNSGLLSLRNGLWVIFGSNLGTTMNAWLVAWLGFSFRIDAFALPFVGLGSILMLAAPGMRTRSFGQALAGFGVLFLGIDALKTSFESLGSAVDLQDFIVDGYAGYLVLVVVGTVLTLLMQASGAVIAIVITAAQGGILSIEAACAMVIGTNIGTTFTAILSALGATANARRLAASHVFFNVITGAVALALLPLLIELLALTREWFAQPATPAIMIALFHTVFNVLGVLLMIPSSDWLLRTLSARFRTRDEERMRPQHLDANSASIPDLAIRALQMELGRTQTLGSECLRRAGSIPADERGVATDRDTLLALGTAMREFAGKLTSDRLPPTLVDKLARSLRILQYQESAIDACHRASEIAVAMGSLPSDELARILATFNDALRHLADAADLSRDDFHLATLEQRLLRAEEDYARLKEALLVAGAHASIELRGLQERLRHASLLRRAAEQTGKAARHLAALDADTADPVDTPLTGHNGDTSNDN